MSRDPAKYKETIKTISSVAENDVECKQNQLDVNNVDAFIQEGFKACIEATRHANALPKDRDYTFHMTQDSFKKVMDFEGQHILSVISKILGYNNVQNNTNAGTIEEKSELIVEANDIILERVATTIDEMNGLRTLPKEPEIQTVSAELPVSGSWNRIKKFSVNLPMQNQNLNTKSIHLLTAKNIVRPQKFFKDKIENGNFRPWSPRISEKPNSLKPLALYMEETEFGDQYSHPYEYELDRFVPAENLLVECQPVKPTELDRTPLYEISTPEQLKNLLEELRKEKEIAVDLEHDSYRSFMGITCLMQISTTSADYIIDTLTLRDKLYILNEIFTRNSIVKIFHGADMDVQWMQRDLSLYVVNMFDTHQAAKKLGYSGLSLSYLLNRFCSFMPNKQFQLADWRIRPLPEELKAYAREDTHYLIYLYEILKNELLKRGNGSDNILKSVFQASTEICKKRYFKPRLTENSHLDFYRKCKRLFDNRQMFALKELYRWRDELAREEDESTGYVLPNHMLLQISEMLPREIQGILACCNPIPPLVRAHSLELHKIILKAREQSLEKPIMKERNSRGAKAKETIKLNIDSPLHCPHDLTQHQEFRDDLPTLLGKNVTSFNKNVKIGIEQLTSSCSVFINCNEKVDCVKKIKEFYFLGPFERYKLVKPFIQAEEEADAKEEKDDPSVEDRIASLHEHFIKVKHAVEQATPGKVKKSETLATFPVHEQSLLNQGGTKKRKRKLSLEPPNSYRPEYKVSENEVQTSLPNIAMGNQNSSFQQHQQSLSKNQKRKLKRNERKIEQEKKEDLPAFDYSTVDFRQFAGGASTAIQSQIKTNFKAKNKNRNRNGGKSNNKSISFGHPAANKRGRGR